MLRNMMGSIKMRLAGSTVALCFGWYFLAAGVGSVVPGSRTGTNAFAGIVMLLGTYAYRSAKRRKLGLREDSVARKAVEMGLLAFMAALVLLQPDALNRMIDHPLDRVLAPLWALFAYITIWNKKASENSDRDKTPPG